MQDRLEGKTAIVASAGIGLSLSKMYEAFAEFEKIPYPVRAFDAIDDAMAWIKS